MALTETQAGPAIGEALEDSRLPLGQAHHVPGYIYYSPEIFALEKEKIFMKDWLCMGRVEEIERPGDYMTNRVMGEPVLIVRDNEGEIHALSNVCRHRGVEVANGAGNVEEFSCPYHGWTYDLSGKLLGAPYMKEVEGFDFSTCRLNPLSVGVWAGWIFINFDESPEPLEKFVAEFDSEMGVLNMGECRMSNKMVVDLNCNWKFVVENIMDIYHVQVLHIDSIGAHIEAEQFKFVMQDRGGYAGQYLAAPDTPSGETLFGKMPWLVDKPDDFALTGYMWPHVHTFARIDETHLMVTWPLSPTTSRLICYHVFPSVHHSQPDFEEKAKVYHDFINGVLEEDRDMVRSLQNGVASRVFRPGPMSKLEVNLHSSINYYLQRIFGE